MRLMIVLVLILSACGKVATCSRLKAELSGMVRWSNGSFTFTNAAAAWKASGCEDTYKET